jgi:phospholipid/cholesterol/gamma-HCH transport system substrate-binding protein
MAKPVNRKLIGGFVVIAVAIMAASVIIFGSGEFFKRKNEFVLYFEGSVMGLNVGAPVVLGGVPIGQVKNIILRSELKENKYQTAVFVETYPERAQIISEGGDVGDLRERVPKLIEKGLRARLVTVSLITGQLGIEADLFPGTPIVLRKNKLDEKYIEIPTIPSTMAKLGKALEKFDVEGLEARLGSILAGADRLINSPDIPAGIHEFKGAMQDARGLLQSANAKISTLTDNLNRTIDDADKLVKNVDGQVKPLSEKAQKAIDDADKLVRNVDDQVKPLSDNVQATLSGAQQAIDLASKDFHSLSGDAGKVLKDLDSHIVPMLDQARNTLVNVDNFIGEDSDTRYKLNQALDSIAAASKSVGSLMDYLEQHPEALLQGKGGK